MPEDLADDLHLHVLQQQEGRRRVRERVERTVGEPRLLEQALESPRYVPTVCRVTHLVREHHRRRFG